MIGRFLAIVVALVPVAGTAAHAGSAESTRVELRDAVRGLEAGAAVRLGDVARITGPLAAELADVEVAVSVDELEPVRQGWVRLGLPAVRRAIEDALPRRLDEIALAGAFVDLRPRDREVAPEPAPAAADPPATPIEAADPTADELPIGSVRSIVARSIAGVLGVPAGDLRLGFEPGDDDLLDRHPGAAHVEARPQATGSVMPIEVTLYEGDRVLESRTVRARASLRAEVTVPAETIPRGERIGASMVRTEPRWLPPGQGAAAAAEVIGRVASARLVRGAVITPDELETALVIERGDLVTLRVRAGSVVVAQDARARSDAGRGERVVVELPATRKRVTARAAGPGLAVAEANAANVGGR